MCPLIKRLKERRELRTLVCVTGQHAEMLDEVLDSFSVVPDFRLRTLREGQPLTELYSRILREVGAVIERARPDLVLVHGDTASALSSALAAFLMGVPIAHVEAGLRSGDLFAPFPEEMNRVLISQLSTLDFAPTESARRVLLSDGKREDSIWVTGNTVIDALRETGGARCDAPILKETEGKRILLLTVHRRENLGAPIQRILRAVLRILNAFPDVCAVLPIHKNPAVREAVVSILGEGLHPQIFLTDPLPVVVFHRLMARSAVVLTDSGGLQEEAPALGKPVIVLRDKTERGEGIQNGGAILTGSDPDRIFSETVRLLSDAAYYASVARVRRLYGDGRASERIAEEVTKYLTESALRP